MLSHPGKRKPTFSPFSIIPREELGGGCVLMDILSTDSVWALEYVTLLRSIVTLRDGGGNWYHQTQTN